MIERFDPTAPLHHSVFYHFNLILESLIVILTIAEVSNIFYAHVHVHLLLILTHARSFGSPRTNYLESGCSNSIRQNAPARPS